jgi:DNA repair protein RecN (Recombination protein N)
MDLLQFRLAEIERVDPEDGEDERLAEERSVLRHAGKIRELSAETFAQLYEADDAVLARLDRAAARLEELDRLGTGVPGARTTFEDARAGLEDLALSLRDLAARAVADPARLEQVEQRLHALEGLKRKHGGTLAEVREAGQRYRRELTELERAETTLEEMDAACAAATQDWTAAALSLGEARQRAGGRLARKVGAELKRLVMAPARLQVAVGKADGDEGPAGVDRVCFLLAANPGEPFQPLDKVASGGELSRVMLALNTVLEAGLLPRTLVFDEVDAGIGGGVADEVGERLARLSGRHQVLCMTHLPQIARRPGRHFKVDKETREGRTRATVSALEGTERIEEIARMLGGRRITATTRRHAEELLGRPPARGAKT